MIEFIIIPLLSILIIFMSFNLYYSYKLKDNNPSNFLNFFFIQLWEDESNYLIYYAISLAVIAQAVNHYGIFIERIEVLFTVGQIIFANLLLYIIRIFYLEYQNPKDEK